MVLKHFFPYFVLFCNSKTIQKREIHLFQIFDIKLWLWYFLQNLFKFHQSPLIAYISHVESISIQNFILSIKNSMRATIVLQKKSNIKERGAFQFPNCIFLFENVKSIRSAMQLSSPFQLICYLHQFPPISQLNNYYVSTLLSTFFQY